jgi:acetylornithine deacetylase/succinyl-diaminopimelate desuccinylase-like protein
MPQPCLTEKGVEIMRPLKEVLEENKQAYIQRLMDLIAIDTHDLGHGIAGGLEKQGQEYMVKLFEDMGADSIRQRKPLKNAWPNIKKETLDIITMTAIMCMLFSKETKTAGA